jgi:3-hydroxymyristoyl/3-hydroxydecanoyl-(acyl carrier protein) dehydratase
MGLPPILHIAAPTWNTREIQLLVEPTLPCFEGHFPGAPVLAGVVQLDWVMALAAREFAVPLIFRGMRSVKFLNLIHPPLPLTLQLTYLPERDLLSFRYQDPIRSYSSGNMFVSSNNRHVSATDTAHDR